MAMLPGRLNSIFLFLGLFSLLLTPFDWILEQDYYGGVLDIAWGCFFVFLSRMEQLMSKLNPGSVKIMQYVLVAFVVISGSLKFINKL